jgi:hypothetical protein
MRSLLFSSLALTAVLFHTACAKFQAPGAFDPAMGSAAGEDSGMNSLRFALFSSAIIPDNRTTDWSGAGVPGGIPNRTTICASLSPGASGDAISAAIQSCNNGVVYLNAGTYLVANGITFHGKSNVTLRGAGPNQTNLVFTSANSCNGVWANICIEGSSLAFTESVPGANVRNWVGGYGKGATQITLDSVSGISPGMVLILDQLDDTWDTGGIIESAAPGFTIEGPAYGRPSRAQEQWVLVTAVSGNQVSISPGLHMPNWRQSQQPQAWFLGPISSVASMNGVEDLALSNGNSSETTAIGFMHAYKSWVKNVKSTNANRSHVWMNQSARIEVRDSYFYGTKNAQSQSYGTETFNGSDNLVINNIFEHVTAPLMIGSTVGSVFAYNFMTDMYYYNATWNIAGISGSHDAGTGMNLFEGNVSNTWMMDLYHGAAALPTVFRNQLTGTQPGRTQSTNAVNIMAFNRSVNMVGNILGTPGYHTVYEDSRVNSGTPGNPDHSVYLLGYAGIFETMSSNGVNYDPRVVSSLLRWGNYDFATRTVRFSAAEIPSGVPVPASQSLPPSLFLGAKPAFFGANRWPPIGPDVTGGQDPSGHVYKIPAQICHSSLGRDGSGTLIFNARSCYASAVAPSPSPVPAPAPAPAPAAFAIGDRVIVTMEILARDIPSLSGVRLGTHLPGELGTVRAGPQSADGYTWYKIDYDTGADGWSTAERLAKYTPAPAPAPSPSPTGLLVGYPLNESSGTAYDASGNGLNALMYNTTVTGGQYWNAQSFNGYSSYIERADASMLTLGAQATFMAWIKLSAAPAETASIFNKWDQTGGDEYIFGVTPARTLYFAFHTTGGGAWPSSSYNDVSGISVLPIGSNVHVAAVRSGASISLYVNGSLDKTVSIADPNPFVNGSVSLRIGGQGRGSRNRYFNGMIDEARIYGSAMSQSAIQSAKSGPLP